MVTVEGTKKFLLYLRGPILAYPIGARNSLLVSKGFILEAPI